MLTTAINLLAGGVTAVIGGFAGSYLSEHFAKGRREADERASYKLSVFSLQLQLIGIYSDLNQYREQLGQSRVAIRAEIPGRYFRAQYHPAYAGEQAPVHFKSEDLRALASIGSNELLNLVADLDRRFNAVIAALNQYRADWLDMAASMHGRVQGEILVMALSEDEIRRLEPKMAAQSKVLCDLDPIVPDLHADVYDALLGLYHASVKSLDQSGSFESLSPNGESVTILPDRNFTWRRRKAVDD